MTNWKRTEREVAKRLGGQRVPITGRQRGDVPDIRHDWLCPEVKHRKSLPQWLLEALQQARAAARGDQLPIAVIHQHGVAHAGDLVVMTLADFVDNFGPCVTTAQQEEPMQI